MKGLYIIILFLSMQVSAGVKNAVADTKKVNEDRQEELLIQNDNDSLLILKKAAWDWFTINKSRLRIYDTAFEIPLAEVKADGFLSPNAFLRKSGSLSGVNEMTAIWNEYTIKVMMTKNALNEDEYRMILTTGLKSPELPQELVPNCYVYSTYKNNGVTHVWDWELMPTSPKLTLPVINTRCVDLPIKQIQIMGNIIKESWTTYGGPTPAPILDPICSVITVLPSGVSEPPLDYEDVVHCIYNYVPAGTFCDGLLDFTLDGGSTVSYNLTQKTNDCNSASQAIYTTDFVSESEDQISLLGKTSTTPICNLSSTHVITCTATETVAPSTWCSGKLYLSMAAGGTQTYNLTQKPNDCDSSSQPAYLASFLGESNNKISSLGFNGSAPDCTLFSSHQIKCYSTEAASTYCDGVLDVNRNATNGGGTSSFPLTRKSNNCDSASQATYLANFTSESNSLITSNSLDVSGLNCVTSNSHLDTCTTTENPGAAALECKVYVYSLNGVLPSSSNPDFEWSDRDCTGFWSGTSGDTILDHLAIVYHYNNVMINGTARINSNEFSDYHYRAGASLGSEFTNDTYYNADKDTNILQFINNYNAANPLSQVENCSEYLGSLSALDAKHKVACDAVPAVSPITLIDVSAVSSWTFIPTSSQSRTSGSININVLPIFGAGANGGSVERFRTNGGDMSGVGTVSFYKDWIRVDAGHTFSEVSNSGFSYKLDFSLSSSSTTNNLVINCPQGSSNVDVVNGGIDVHVSASWPTTLERKSGSCSYVGTIKEYNSATPTGKTSSVSLSVNFVYETR